MTIRPSPYPLLPKLPALALTALIVCSSCVMTPTSAAQQPHAKAKTSTASSRSFPGKRPDPRYRPATNFSELQAVAAEVAKATGRKIHWRLSLGKDPGPLAKISGGLENCIISIHPLAAKKIPPNTWAFIFGHEFAHRTESVGTHAQTTPANELKADIAGARFAMAAGYRLESFLGWVLTEPNQHSDSHGYPHDRVYAIAAHFRVPKSAVQAQAKRYAKYRATH